MPHRRTAPVHIDRESFTLGEVPVVTLCFIRSEGTGISQAHTDKRAAYDCMDLGEMPWDFILFPTVPWVTIRPMGIITKCRAA
jgi:hypothetical protein